MQTLLNIASIAFLVFGFGFVIFWHELGHFLAAKAVGIKVEQFAVGMGNAMVSWRKGLGMVVGSSAEKYQKKILSEWEKRKAAGDPLASNNTGPSATEELAIADSLGLGETEYRLNYLPLGGYVKMLGQDDMDLAARSADPRSYTSKSIPARMFVVSAGVIMNILLAAALFTFLFSMIGFNAPPALVGSVSPNSPAAKAGVKPGDRILSINGGSVRDFTSLQLGIVLLPEGQAVPMEVERDGKTVALSITPEKSAATGNVLALGVGPTPALRGLKPGTEIAREKPEESLLPDVLALKNDELVTAINGVAIPAEKRGDSSIPNAYPKLIDALEASDGKPVALTVEKADGSGKHEISVRPYFPFATFTGEYDFAGMSPRPMITDINEKSSALGKILPGDIVTSVVFDDTADTVQVTSAKSLRDVLVSAGKSGQKFTVHLLRNGQPATAAGIQANIKISKDAKGLGIVLDKDTSSAVVGDVRADSSAARAGLVAGDTLLAINDKPVGNFFEVRRALLTAGLEPAKVSLKPANGEGTVVKTLQLTQSDLDTLAAIRPVTPLALDERLERRITSNPMLAMKWGVLETRDLILNGYLTIKRIAQGSVPASMMNGPVGIFHVGGMIAVNKTIDWTFWFLAMISANLAVVNFLPIPIVDGGLFLFLILEKVMGRPLSPRTQQIIQLAGLALIASVFLFVTYNDLSRLLS